MDVNFSVFNLINSSAPVAIPYLSGTFGRVTDILAPRWPVSAYNSASRAERVCHMKNEEISVKRSVAA